MTPACTSRRGKCKAAPSFFFRPKTRLRPSLPARKGRRPRAPERAGRLIARIESHIGCWKRFNDFVNLARAKKFGSEDESHFHELKKIIAQDAGDDFCRHRGHRGSAVRQGGNRRAPCPRVVAGPLERSERRRVARPRKRLAQAPHRLAFHFGGGFRSGRRNGAMFLFGENQ